MASGSQTCSSLGRGPSRAAATATWGGDQGPASGGRSVCVCQKNSDLRMQKL